MATRTDGGQPPYRELTVASVLLGIVLGLMMTAAFVFIGLKLGFTLPGSTVAAILGFAVLRGVFKKGSIVENNINQTVASGVNNASSGVVFTLPALFLLGLSEAFSPWPVILAATAGSFLGIVLIIPLRKQMIEFERLKFPSGIAVASLLKSPGAGARQAKLLIGGFGVAALIHALAFYHVLPEELNLGGAVGVASYFPLAVAISFASLGAGLLSGKGGLPFVGGGVLAWWVISPLVVWMGWVALPTGLIEVSAPAYDGWQISTIYSSMLRPLGIGVLIGGALSGVIASFPALKSALKSLSSAKQTMGAAGGTSGSDELSARVLYLGLIGAVVVLFVAALLSTETVGVGTAAVIAVVGTLWLALAGMIVAQATGMTDISPLSGLSLIAVTLMFFLTGGNQIASVIIGVAVCIGIGQCADMMSDLKSGHLVGSTPKRQQIAQFMVGWMGVPVAVGTLYLLWNNGGFGAGSASGLSAPQGEALKTILEGLAKGESAVDKFGAGALIGLMLGIIPIGGIGVLVGLAMYLPFSITVTYGIGCLISIYLSGKKGPRWIGSTLVPVSAGFIVGEALTTLVLVLIGLATG